MRSGANDTDDLSLNDGEWRALPNSEEGSVTASLPTHLIALLAMDGCFEVDARTLPDAEIDPSYPGSELASIIAKIPSSLVWLAKGEDLEEVLKRREALNQLSPEWICFCFKYQILDVVKLEHCIFEVAFAAFKNSRRGKVLRREGFLFARLIGKETEQCRSYGLFRAVIGLASPDYPGLLAVDLRRFEGVNVQVTSVMPQSVDASRLVNVSVDVKGCEWLRYENLVVDQDNAGEYFQFDRDLRIAQDLCSKGRYFEARAHLAAIEAGGRGNYAERSILNALKEYGDNKAFGDAITGLRVRLMDAPPLSDVVRPELERLLLRSKAATTHSEEISEVLEESLSTLEVLDEHDLAQAASKLQLPSDEHHDLITRLANRARALYNGNALDELIRFEQVLAGIALDGLKRTPKA